MNNGGLLCQNLSEFVAQWPHKVVQHFLGRRESCCVHLCHTALLCYMVYLGKEHCSFCHQMNNPRLCLGSCWVSLWWRPGCAVLVLWLVPIHALSVGMFPVLQFLLFGFRTIPKIHPGYVAESGDPQAPDLLLWGRMEAWLPVGWCAISISNTFSSCVCACVFISLVLWNFGQ